MELRFFKDGIVVDVGTVNALGDVTTLAVYMSYHDAVALGAVLVSASNENLSNGKEG